jgi:nitronate monooxygenase
MGTRFIATKEAPVHENVKQAILAASELDTRLIMRPMRNTERVLSNGAVDRIIEIERQKGADLKIEDIRHLVGSVYPKVMTDGDLEAGAWSCGMVVGLINDIPSCQELIERLIAEAKDIIRGNLTALLAD